MKKLLPFITTLLLCIAVFAQESDEAKYSKQYSKLYKEYIKEPTNVSTMLALVDFYMDTLNPMHDYASAMRYATAAESRYITILEDRDKYKEVSKLIKKKVSITSVRQTKQRVISQTRRYLDNVGDLSEATLDSYSQAFKDDAATMRLIDGKRLQYRYHRALEANTMEAYKEFYDRYAQTDEGEDVAIHMARLASELVEGATSEEQVDAILADYTYIEKVRTAAYNKKSSIAYSYLLSHPSQQAYNRFLSKYPGSNEYSKVLEMADKQLEKEFSTLTTPRQYADFALKNSDNSLADRATEKLKQMIRVQRDIDAMRIYLNEFKNDAEYNDIYQIFFQWHTEEGNLSPIATFDHNNPDFPFKASLEDALTSAVKFDSININRRFDEKEFKEWSSMIYHLTGKKESYVALQRTLQNLIAKKDWKKVIERIEFFALSFEDNCTDEVSELKSIISSIPDKNIISTPVVRPVYDMMHPIMHPNGKQLFFNRTTSGVTTIQSAQTVSGKKGVVWKSSGDITFTNIENKNVILYNFFDNGKKMLLGIAGDIAVGELGEGGWTVTETLPSPINSPYNDFDAYMLPDGSGILFASDRPGGHNLQPSGSYFHGDTASASDIYFVPCTDNGWGEAINLGKEINTPYMECSPYISNDKKTIYFVTDGRGGLGYGDIYYAVRDDVNDWTHWTKPMNYGKEVNSGFNEISVSPSPDGSSLLICSNAAGRYGCYSIPAAHTFNSDFKTVTVEAHNIGLVITIVDMGSFKSVCDQQTVVRESNWQNRLYNDKQYLLYSECDGLLIPAIEFTPSKTAKITPKSYDEEMLLSMSNDGTTLPLPGILFNKNAIVPCSEIEMDHLATFLLQHESLYVELIEHEEGSDDTYCYNLSLSHGQTIKNYLVSKGVVADRIVISAYGNSQTKLGKAKSGTSVMIHLL